MGLSQSVENIRRYSCEDQEGITTASDLFLGVFVLTVSILAFVGHALPGWVRWIGILSGTCLIVGGGALTTPYGSVGPLIVVGFAAFVLWVASTSVLTLLGRVRARPWVYSPGP